MSTFYKQKKFLCTCLHVFVPIILAMLQWLFLYISNRTRNIDSSAPFQFGLSIKYKNKMSDIDNKR
jgi:hypothetical protein